MDNVYEISLLLDFYGQLLTEKQYEILDLHYNNDYSLGEIAEQFNISRQGVFDNIKRGKAVLSNLEKKLGLVMKFSEQKSKAEEILIQIESLERNTIQQKDRETIDAIEKGIQQIINKF